MLVGTEPSIQAALARLAKPAASSGWATRSARELSKNHETWIVGRGLALSLAGAAIGVAGGFGLIGYLKTLLYGVTPHDPATLASGCALVLLVTLAAAYLPARRAVKQDALAALRVE